MKILYVLNSGSPGGMEQHVLDLCDQMVSRGHEVYVWCKAGIVSDLYKKAKAKVYEREITSDIDISYILELRAFIKKNNIDVVHAHELKASVNALISSFLAGVKARVSHVHTPISNWRIPRVRRLLNNILYGLVVNLLSSKEIALTESVKMVKVSSGILAKKISVLPNGINTYRFSFTDNEKAFYKREIKKKYKIDQKSLIVGNISRLTKEKGHTLLLRAFANLKRSDCTLLICGGGELEDELWHLAEDLHVKDRIVITGVFDDSLKEKLYSSFDLFVFPSLAEGFGIVLLEALSSGLPVISSDITVLKEVGGEYPRYFRSGDVLSLTSVLEDSIDDISDASDRSSQVNHVSNMYSLDAFGENYERLYNQLTGKVI